MDWLMIPFAVFYLMLAALAVVVWLQLRGDRIKAPALKPPRRGVPSRHTRAQDPATGHFAE
jgi:hypothetical protein